MQKCEAIFYICAMTEKNIPRTMITIDGYKFEVNTIGKYTERDFKEAFENLSNFHWKNAYRQVRKKWLEISKDVEA